MIHMHAPGLSSQGKVSKFHILLLKCVFSWGGEGVGRGQYFAKVRCMVVMYRGCIYRIGDFDRT